jgi:hypothetical protein
LNGRIPPDSNAVAGVSLQDDVASENSEDKLQYATIVLPVKEAEAPSTSKVLLFLHFCLCRCKLHFLRTWTC